MNQATRAIIAATAAEKVSGQHIDEVYDYALGKALPVTTHLSPEMMREAEKDAVVLQLDSNERVSLHVHDDLFSGWDHRTGAYFAGAIYESDVMLYDGYERRYFKFSVH